jgi:uncharacterized protein HemX
MPIISKTKNAGLKGISSVIILVLLVLCIFLSFSVYNLKRQLSQLNEIKQKEYSEKLAKEKDLIRKDFESKQSADMVSYQALAKRIELEKKKSVELEQKLKKIESEKPKKK